MTVQASGEPGLVRPLREAVEKTIKAQIDKGNAAAKPTENRQTVSHEDAVLSRDETITKISSAEFYQDVGRSVREILQKRAGKVPPQFLSKKKNGGEDEEKGKKDLPPFMKSKGKKEEETEEEEEEETEEEEPKKGKKAKKAEKREEEEEPKFPMFGKKPKKAE